MRAHAGNVVRPGRDLPGDEVVDRGPRALVGNVQDIDLRQALQQLHRQVVVRAAAIGAVRDRPTGL